MNDLLAYVAVFAVCGVIGYFAGRADARAAYLRERLRASLDDHE